jgi:hypothetical protein
MIQVFFAGEMEWLICDNREPMTSMSLSPQAHATAPTRSKPMRAGSRRIVLFPSASM